MGDEGLFAIDDEPHAAARLAREQSRDQFDVERLGAAAKAAADMRFDYANPRHVHVENLRQHQVHVIRHLRRSVHGHAIANRVVIGDRGVHFHLVLADFGAIIDALAHQIGAGKSCFDVAEFEQHVAFEIMRTMLMNGDGIRRHRLLRVVIGRQLADGELDSAQRFLGRCVVDRRNGGERLAAIAHALARQHMFSARDRKNTKGFVAFRAGDDRFDAGQLRRLGNVDFEDFRMRIGTAENPSG